MFSTSSQLKFWMFPPAELEKLREESNQRYIDQHPRNVHFDDDSRLEFFLNVEEEAKIRQHYECILTDFCLQFQPPMPPFVMGTSMSYFKRFFVHNSVMNHHPKDILYTCVYLACKVEEFNLPIQQFVQNISCVDAEKAMDLILSQELLLMEVLHFHLTVHNPYRPVEGLLIDIKTRCPEIPDPDKLRKGVDAFLQTILHTDASLLFSPSQIALSSLVTSGANCGINLDSYVANKLVDTKGHENLRKIVEHIQKLRQMVRNIESLLSRRNEHETEMKTLEEKLEKCRNDENNPDSTNYKQKTEEFSDEEERNEETQKRLRMTEDAVPMEAEENNVDNVKKFY